MSMKNKEEEATVRIHVPPTERIVPLSASSTGAPVAPAPSEAEPNLTHSDRLFDHYSIYSKIGDGGMGVVYLARDKRLDRFVAIKRLNIQAQTIPALRQRFLCEARAVAALSHVHIIHIYALGEDDDGPYIVMEYIAGPDDPEFQKEPSTGGLNKPNAPLTLDQHVAKHGQYNLEDACTLVSKIGRAVTYAHASGVIHRDLKPSNILLDKTNEPKIVDFGLARLVHHTGETENLTVPGEKLLSLGYGAPEQETDAKQSDERADVYGLGGLLYFLLTGQNPRYFREQDVPVQIREVVVKALATDKEQRWQSAQAFVDALTQARERTKITLPTVKTTWRCKWCDAVNPLTLKYCAECGWDGSEACPECGADSFIGVQYCGNCGADTRAYEMLGGILAKIRQATEEHRFERVILYAGRIHGFEPAGPTGRQYLNEIGTLREQAEKSIRKRNQLKDQIPIEIRAENYERAALFISQYRALSEEQHVFLSEEQSLPELILKRDMGRIQQSIRHHDWLTARRLYAELSKAAHAQSSEDFIRLGKRIKNQRILKRIHTSATLAFTFFILYLAILPLFARQFKGTKRTAPYHVSRPGLWFYESSLLSAPLQYYAQNWLGKRVTLRSCLTSGLESEGTSPNNNAQSQNPEFIALEQKKSLFGQQLGALVTSQEAAVTSWSEAFLKELEALIERRRTAGDFEGWTSAQEERKKFEENGTIDEETNEPTEDTTDLRLLKSKYRQSADEQRILHHRRLLTLSRKYITDLTELQRNYMQGGQMNIASAINTEIRRVRSLPQYLAAERDAQRIAVSGDPDALSPAFLSDGTQPQELDLIQQRKEIEQKLADIESKAQQTAGQWADDYLHALNGLMDKYQRAGDYMGWESVREEATRFEADRIIQSKHLVLDPEKLLEVQNKYYQQRDTLRRAKAKSIVDAIQTYLASLQRRQKGLTVKGQMEAAAVVQAEIKRIQSRLDFTEAQSLLAVPLPDSTRTNGTNGVTAVRNQ
jgi:serine/threonine protein kinase